MIQAHVVNTHNKQLYTRAFDEFLRRRLEHCAAGSRRVPLSDDGLELDPFDAPQATYLLGMKDDRVIASARLMPTVTPNLVSERFACWCQAIDAPCHPEWADLTRTCVLPGYHGLGRAGLLSRMLCAVMEYCLDEGITHTGGVVQQTVLKRWLDMGWKVIPAGLPRLRAGDWCMVAYAEVSEKSLTSARDHAGIDHPLVRRNGAQRPFITPAHIPARNPTREAVS
ncbi:acyl-homoserine-lactone synthase [Hoeflea ulvae]|uniref:Acyl-homoserine-lactone synthase n=1 Tax=Hoeflea ulvae TaxID=2983764 RepID=A0ABT3YHW0_9HYPH|nr:acyl-homoserine-lactone synthase [Hoeflea ulvae]MCY0095471.1 autoinducer synthase [Hoeflea ulvae]